MTDRIRIQEETLPDAFYVQECIRHEKNTDIPVTAICFVGNQVAHTPIEEFTIPETYQGKIIDCLMLGNYLPKSLKRLHISKNISYIWGRGFGNSIEEITIDPDNEYYSTDGIGIYTKDGSKLICLAKGLVEEYIVCPGTKVIGDSAFEGCDYNEKIKKIILPDSIVELERYAFSGQVYRCLALEEIMGLENVKKVGDYAFDGTKFIREKALITADHGKILIKRNKIDSFNNLIPDGTEVIKSYCFRRMEDEPLVETITIPNTVKVIEEYGLSALLSVESITIPESVCDISSEAFPYTLREIHVDMGNPVYASIDNKLCFKDTKEIVCTPQCRHSGRRKSNIVVTAEFIIKDGVLLGYTGTIGNDVILPSGIHTIGKGAFKSDENIFSVVVPDGVKKIEDSAFAECNHMESIELPETLEIIGKSAFAESGLHKLKIPQNVKKIGKNALGYSGLNEIYNYSDISILTHDIWGEAWQKELQFMIIPTGYFPHEVIEGLSKDVQRTAIFAFCRNMELYSEEEQDNYLRFIKGHRKSLQNFLKNCDHISVDDREIIEKVLKMNSPKNEKKIIKISAENQNISKELDEIVNSIKKDFNVKVLEKTWEKIGGNALETVKLADGLGEAPILLLQCAIIPYVDQTINPKSTQEYEKQINPVQYIELAEKAYEQLDKSSLSKAITKLCKKMEIETKWIMPWARYATDKDLDNLLKLISSTWPKQKAQGKKKVIIAKTGLLLNKDKKAALYFDSINALDTYAHIQGMEADLLRENVLYDFGFDYGGQKEYDLGKTIICLQYYEDGRIALYNKQTGEELNSIPTSGQDKEKVKAAKEDYEEIKKMVQKAYSIRKELLFSWYLDKTSKIKAKNWKKSYIENPVFRVFAKTIVWVQNTTTFIVNSDNEIINSKGRLYDLTNDGIGVAHVLEMTDEEINAWRTYMTNNSIEQPFEQVKEIKYNLSELENNRYAGCYIPQYRFKDVIEHGITFIYGNSYSGEENSVVLQDLDVDCREKYYIPEDTDDETILYEKAYDAFVLYRVQINYETRFANHIIYLLDKWTSEQRIEGNQREEIIPFVVQLFDFIKKFTVKELVLMKNIRDRFPDKSQEEINGAIDILKEKGAIASYETVVGIVYDVIV